MNISERFLSELESYGITAYTIEKKFNVAGAQQKVSNYKKGRIQCIPIDVIEGACIGEPKLDVEFIITGRKSKDELAEKINSIGSIIENLNKQIKAKDDRIKTLEIELSKKAL